MFSDRLNVIAKPVEYAMINDHTRKLFTIKHRMVRVVWAIVLFDQKVYHGRSTHGKHTLTLFYNGLRWMRPRADYLRIRSVNGKRHATIIIVEWNERNG